MKALFSPYLNGLRGGLKALIGRLEADWDYVSALATDSKGLAVRISQHARSVSSETMTTERGIVIRVQKGGAVSEYAFNRFDPDDVENAAARIEGELGRQEDLLKELGVTRYPTPDIPDEPCELFVEKEARILPEDADVKAVVTRLGALSDRAASSSGEVIEAMCNGQSTHVNKMFLSPHRDMRQSYVYSEGSAVIVAMREGRNQMGYESVSGMGGLELLDGLDAAAERAGRTAFELLDAERIVPGEYEVITSPEVSGLIAHEAFGHGVEMDMFVKNRALGKEYIGKRVGSDMCTMHEGALCVENVSSYAFDDEGTPAGDVVEIDRGILKTGVCDALAALRLGVRPTGNGKRENFEHKVYTRMTNTVFESGDSTLDEMIASVKYGYLLAGMQSGMEDPKHWGIQCIIDRGYEIRDGALTGKVVSPIVMTGYVPDLLGSISMLSRDHELFGSGGCGKGHKEWVKVSDGGPYLKTKARLG